MKKSIFIITALCSHILAVAQLDTASFNDNFNIKISSQEMINCKNLMRKKNGSI